MNKTKQSRRVASEKLRAILTQIADDICRAQKTVRLALSGDTFQIHLEGATININLSKEGGEA